MYKKDLEFGNPKKFQRKVFDISNNVLSKRGYYFSKYHSHRPFLKANGITNLADFDGVLCFIKQHTNYNLISRIMGVISMVMGGVFLATYFESQFTHLSSELMWGIILLVAGLILFFVKFSKDICIKIRLTGESYRTDEKKQDKSIEYLDVRSHAQLTIRGTTLDPKKGLSMQDSDRLHDDGQLVVDGLSKLLEAFAEK